MMHFPVFYNKIGEDIGYAPVQYILNKRAGASEAAAAYQYNFPAACQQPAHFIVFILEDTFPGRFEPAAKTAYTGLYRTIVTNFNYIFILYCGHCSGGQVVNNQPLLVRCV